MAAKRFDLSGKRVWIAGHRGMVGSALTRALSGRECTVLSVPRDELDLRRQAEVEAWMERCRPQAVVIAAATVGGIQANIARPAQFGYDNLMITANIIEAAHRVGVERLMVLGSACVYPRLAPQPMGEDLLMTGALEPTNEPYAVAKLAGISLAGAYRRQYGRDYFAVIPTNLYGPGDNLDPEASHVVPAMLRKVALAAQDGGPVEIWGTGRPEREFLYVDDASEASLFRLEHYAEDGIINIGAGETVTIAQLAARAAQAVGYHGAFRFDESKPDGMPRKQLDASRLLALGWRPRISLDAGLAATWAWMRPRLETR
jgi:GDP-L-fucose synthase